MLAFKKNGSNKLAKLVLCVDLGNVLVKYKPTRFKKLLKKDKWSAFLELAKLHDISLPAWEMHKEANKLGLFKRHLRWTEFFAAYDDAVAEIHQPMFEALKNLKKAKNTRLICITDNNPLCIFATTRKFPEIFDLFREGNKENWVISHLICSLKVSETPFAHAVREFGFSLKDACFVDDMQHNLNAFARAGGSNDRCFLYNVKSKRNHAQFEKFLKKHFSPE